MTYRRGSLNHADSCRLLNFRQKLFLRYCCYPPPGKEKSRIDNSLASELDPLALLKKKFGSYFLESIKGNAVLDIGCGEGDQVIAVALEGASYAVGAEIRPIFKEAENRAKHISISDKVKFTTSRIRELGEAVIDVAFSQNSFEHFADPNAILNDAFYVLKGNGNFFVTFGPPWLHPYGVHMCIMIKYPWPHIVFSERTIMSVRKLYRSDNANRFEEVEGGLNKMTIRKFTKYSELCGFKLEKLSLTPVKGLWPLTKIPFIREFFTAEVSAILLKC